MATRITLSTSEIRDRIQENKEKLVGVDLKAIEAYLGKLEYRAEYNSRPEVKAKRKEYNLKRREEEKQTAALINALLAEKAGNQK